MPAADRSSTSRLARSAGRGAPRRRGGESERHPVDSARPARHGSLGLSAWSDPRRLAGGRGSGGRGLGPRPFRSRVVAGMGRRNRLTFQLVGHLAILRRILMATMAVSVARRPDRVLERGVAATVDRRYLLRADVRRILVESLSEAFRSGSRGPAWEMGVYARPWGFRLEDIRTPMHLWHGEEDANAPAGDRKLSSDEHSQLRQFLPERRSSSLRRPPARDLHGAVRLIRAAEGLGSTVYVTGSWYIPEKEMRWRGSRRASAPSVNR
jgi:hypothetical protein